MVNVYITITIMCMTSVMPCLANCDDNDNSTVLCCYGDRASVRSKYYCT